MTNVQAMEIEAKQNIANNKLVERLDYVEKVLNRLGQDFKVMSVESSKVHVEYSSQFRRIDENFNEKFRLVGQEIAHLKTVTYPSFWEAEIKELKDIIYSTRTELREEVAYWKAFRENHYFELVTQQEAIEWVKISGVQLKELSDLLGIAISNVSRKLSGERQEEDYVAYHKIKAYCMDKFNKSKKNP